MKYELLSKLYYKNPDKYDDIYNSRFAADSTIHIPLDVHGNQAFIVPTFEMMNLLNKIYTRSNAINNMFFDKLDDIGNYIVWDFIKDDIVISNAIEGVSSTRKEVEIAIHNQKSQLPVRFKSLVGKYQILLTTENYEIHTCEDVRKLYDAVTDGEIDESNLPDGKIFRKEQVSVISATQKEKHKGIVPEEKIIEYMEKALDFLNADDDIPTLIKIAVFHYFFGYIHPFYDGNGRTSRLISSFKMVEELGFLIPLRLSYAIKNNVKKYYDAFDFCNDIKNKGDITPFVYAFFELIADSLDGVIDKLNYVLSQLKFYESKINKLSNNSKCKLVWMEVVKCKVLGNGDITVKMLVDQLGLNVNTIYRHLNYAEQIGLVFKNRISHTYFYGPNLEMLDNI